MNPEHASLMQQIYEIAFALDDTILFLNTHPCDQEALDYYEMLQARHMQLMEEHARHYGPLLDDRVMIPPAGPDRRWTWNDGPMPWEGGCR